MWLGKVTAIFTRRTSLLHRVSVLGFFNSKIRKCMSLVSTLLFDFYFRCACLNYLPSLRFKEQREQRKMYHWRRNIKQMLSNKLYHVICSFKRYSSTMSLSQLLDSYILRKLTQWKNILDNKNFIKLLTNQNFCLQRWQYCVV